MDEVFLQAALLQPPTILGRRLKPFSAGHVFVLDAIGNKALFSRRNSLQNLLQTLLVCCQSWRENSCMFGVIPSSAGFLCDPAGHAEALRKVESWGRGLRLRPGARRLLQAELQVYVRAFTRRAEHWDIAEKRGYWKLRVPWPFGLVTSLVIGTKGALTLEQAWDLPLGFAWCLCDAIGNLNGTNTLITPDEQKAREAVRAGPAPRPRLGKDKHGSR